MPVQFYYNLYIILFAAWRRRYLLVIPVLVMPLLTTAVDAQTTTSVPPVSVPSGDG